MQGKHRKRNNRGDNSGSQTPEVRGNERDAERRKGGSKSQERMKEAMSGDIGRGEIPSYKNVTTGETGERRSRKEIGNERRDASVMGNQWKARLGGRCLPRTLKKSRFVIPNNKLEEYIFYMRDHALICKFVGF